MRQSLFYPITIGFITGVFLRSNHKIDLSFVLFFCVSVCSIGLYLFFSHDTHTFVFVFVVFLLSMTFGGIRYHIFTSTSGDPQLYEKVGKEELFRVLIISEPDLREKGVRFIGELSEYKNTKILFTDHLYSTLQYGDVVDLRGILELPENFETDNGRTFDYVSFLAKDKIFYLIKNPEIKVLDHHQASRLKEFLFAIKNKYIGNIDEVVPFPASTLASGITIAGKGALPKNIEEEFQRTGTLQAVVLSGYNTTIVAEAFMTICSFLPFALASTVGVLGLISFTIMAGGSATVIRGSIMAMLVIFAKLIRRRYSVTRALTLAAVLMLLFNPMLLVYDPSFQLSFLATLGLICVSPIIEKHLHWLTERFELRQMISSGIAAQLFVTPFLLYSSGELSVVALPTNSFLGLLMPITMLMCFMTGAVGFVSTFLAVPISFLAFMFLWIELTIVHIFSVFPYASVSISYFPLWLVVLVYIGFAVLVWRFNRAQRKLLAS